MMLWYLLRLHSVKNRKYVSEACLVATSLPLRRSAGDRQYVAASCSPLSMNM